MNDGVIFYKSHFEIIKDLSNEELGLIFRCCMTDTEAPMEPHIKMAFNFVYSRIKKNAEDYALTCEKRRNAGKMGGAPKGNKNAKKSDSQCDEENNQNKQMVEKTSKTSKYNINKEKEMKDNQTELNKINTSTDVDVNNNTVTPSIDFLKEKSSWIEMVAMNYGLDIQGVHRWIDKFQLEVIDCKLKTHANNKDLASHFCDWLRIKLEQQTKKTPKPAGRMQQTNDALAAYIESLSS